MQTIQSRFAQYLAAVMFKAKNMKSRAALYLTSLLVSLVATPAFAGTTGTEFQALYNLVNNWATGYLGRTIAVAAFIVGGVVGFAKQTAMPALIGIVFAIVFGLGPTIITNIMTATI